MLVEVLLISVSGVVLGAIAHRAWERREERAREQAATRDRLARVGASVEGLAHDLNNLFTIISFQLDEAIESGDASERKESLREMERAMMSASKLLQALQASADGTSAGDGSVEGVVRLTVALLRNTGPRISLVVDGDMGHAAGNAEATRLVRGLIVGAVHEASAVDGATVRVELSEDRLVVQHPTRDDGWFDAWDHESTRGFGGMSALGRHEAEDAARTIGWSLHREVVPRCGGTKLVRFELRRF